MIVGRTRTSTGMFYIMATIRGCLTRVGRYHSNVGSAQVQAIKLKRELGSAYVQVINRSNGWHWQA